MSAEYVQDFVNVLQGYETECKERAKQYGNTSDLVCPWIWDGILCWEPTELGELSIKKCPTYFVGFDVKANATKYCTLNGSWYVSPDEGNYWTNFTECMSNNTHATIFVPFQSSGNMTLLQAYIPILKTMVEIGYRVSLTSLILAFIILASLQKLRCPRNLLHLHLFMSFIMRAAMTLIKFGVFKEGVALEVNFKIVDGESFFVEQDEDGWLCKAFITLWEYFIMANYSWILMEGLYIHNLIILALFHDSSSILAYVVLGWGCPLILISIWVLIRILNENKLCWTLHENEFLFLVIRIPIAISIIINFVLYVNIVQLLFKKVRSSIGEDRQKYRKWAKSTLVLIPLFGVHYFVFLGMSYSIGKNETVELIWLFCDQAFASFQGFFVAVLYCFLNGEVQLELSNKWKNSKIYRRSPTFGQYPPRSSFASLSSYSAPCTATKWCRFLGPKQNVQCRFSKRAETMEFVTIESIVTESIHEINLLKIKSPDNNVNSLEMKLVDEINTST